MKEYNSIDRYLAAYRIVNPDRVLPTITIGKGWITFNDGGKHRIRDFEKMIETLEKRVERKETIKKIFSITPEFKIAQLIEGTLLESYTPETLLYERVRKLGFIDIDEVWEVAPSLNKDNYYQLLEEGLQSLYRDFAPDIRGHIHRIQHFNEHTVISTTKGHYNSKDTSFIYNTSEAALFHSMFGRYAAAARVLFNSEDK